MGSTVATNAAAPFVFATLLAAAPAVAAGRAFVSAKDGADSPTCGAMASPCRTFQTAHDNVAASGEISVLDPGDYSPLHITKAVSIVNGGVGTAGVLETLNMGEAITIDAGAGDKVSLRGLTLAGNGIGLYGVRFNVGGSLSIANCVVRGFQNSGAGIYIAPNVPANFSIADTSVTFNNQGVRVFPAANVAVSGVIDQVSATGNVFGMEIIGMVGAPVVVTVTRSIASNNQVWGLISQQAVTTAREVVASHNGPGTGDYYSGSGFITTSGTLRLAHSVATGNAYGVTVNGGLVESYGDNDLRGNATNDVNAVSGAGGVFSTVAKQ